MENKICHVEKLSAMWRNFRFLYMLDMTKSWINSVMGKSVVMHTFPGTFFEVYKVSILSSILHFWRQFLCQIPAFFLLFITVDELKRPRDAHAWRNVITFNVKATDAKCCDCWAGNWVQCDLNSHLPQLFSTFIPLTPSSVACPWPLGPRYLKSGNLKFLGPGGLESPLDNKVPGT